MHWSSSTVGSKTVTRWHDCHSNGALVLGRPLPAVLQRADELRALVVELRANPMTRGARF